MCLSRRHKAQSPPDIKRDESFRTKPIMSDETQSVSIQQDTDK